MSNSYPGVCYRCGQVVNARAGHFEMHPTAVGKWRLQHAECAIHHRGRDVAPLTDEQRAEMKATRRRMMDKRWGKVRATQPTPEQDGSR